MSREAVDKKSGPEPQSPVDTTELEDSDRLTKRILWKLDTRCAISASYKLASVNV